MRNNLQKEIINKFINWAKNTLVLTPEKSKGMADKQEKDLDQASDCEWVRGLDADGNSIRIAKTDLVELIRANMPVAVDGKKGLINYGDLLIYKGDLVDCNHAYHGIYRVLSNSVNTPISVDNAAILISFICYMNESYKMQLFFDLTGNTILYWRRKVDAYWSAWSAL